MSASLMFPLLLIWLHILAAVTWIGGMMFLSFVLVPLVRKRSATPEFMLIFRSAAQRFRIVVWLAIVTLLSTGPMLLHGRGISTIDMTQWPPILLVKAGLVVVLLLVTFVHDLLLGPLASRSSAIPACAQTAWGQILLRTSRWVPRLALAVALGVLLVAVVLVRS
jgi:copper resistance protein D